MKQKYILWVARHAPLAAQIKELKQYFPKYKVLNPQKDKWRKAEEIIDKAKEINADILVVILPTTIIQKLLEYTDFLILYSHAIPRNDEYQWESDFFVKDTHYRFDYFEVIRKITVDKMELSKYVQQYIEV